MVCLSVEKREETRKRECAAGACADVEDPHSLMLNEPTLLTSQPPMGWLKLLALWNAAWIQKERKKEKKEKKKTEIDRRKKERCESISSRRRRKKKGVNAAADCCCCCGRKHALTPSQTAHVAHIPAPDWLVEGVGAVECCMG